MNNFMGKNGTEETTPAGMFSGSLDTISEHLSDIFCLIITYLLSVSLAEHI
jgi:hypothetical protein